MSNMEEKKPIVYQNDRIKVYWRPWLCQHAAQCLTWSPEVFDPMRRPWVEVDAAPVEEIVETIGRCPSGALSCELK